LVCLLEMLRLKVLFFADGVNQLLLLCWLLQTPLPFLVATSSARLRISQPAPSLPVASRAISVVLCLDVSSDEEQKLGHIFSLSLWSRMVSGFACSHTPACYKSAEKQCKSLLPLIITLFCACSLLVVVLIFMLPFVTDFCSCCSSY
jgi:hypothetical protein